jgi:hypothetical protein
MDEGMDWRAHAREMVLAGGSLAIAACDSTPFDPNAPDAPDAHAIYNSYPGPDCGPTRDCYVDAGPDAGDASSDASRVVGDVGVEDGSSDAAVPDDAADAAAD